MFKEYFGLQKPIFQKEIQTDSLFENEYLSEFRARMDYMKKTRGIILLTGDPGTGKTTAVRSFLESLSQELFMTCYSPLATVSIGDFYKQLNDKLNGENVSSKVKLFKSIQERILHYSVSMNKIPVIVIDEAHLLKNDNFFELQIICNFQMDSLDPAIIILIAQTHLLDRLNRTYLESFNQRINLKYHFSHFTPKQTNDYIKHQLKIAKSDTTLFSENALKAIHKLTDGVIRKINQLCLKSMSLAVTIKKRKITDEEVMVASKEM